MGFLLWLGPVDSGNIIDLVQDFWTVNEPDQLMKPMFSRNQPSLLQSNQKPISHLKQENKTLLRTQHGKETNNQEKRKNPSRPQHAPYQNAPDGYTYYSSSFVTSKSFRFYPSHLTITGAWSPRVVTDEGE